MVGVRLIFCSVLMFMVADGFCSLSAQDLITTVAGSDLVSALDDVEAGNAPLLKGISSVAVGPRGNIFLSAGDKVPVVAEILTTGRIHVIASGDNAGSGLALDQAGNLYIADHLNYVVRKMAPDGSIITVAGNGHSGNSGDGGPATSASLVPFGLACDNAGSLYISDAVFNRVRKVSAAGIITTVAGSDVPITSDEGGPATAANLRGPVGLAVDASQNLYIADSGNYRVVRVARGIITTVAGKPYRIGASGDGGPAVDAGLASPTAVAVDAKGNLYISETDGVIRRVDTGGAISTVAGRAQLRIILLPEFWGDGGPATMASLIMPTGVAVDSSGNVYIADSVSARLRKVSPDGIITTVAGSVRFGDGGSASKATLNAPQGIALDASGNLYIADTNSHVVRKVTPSGIISVFAGNGETEPSSYDGLAVSARLSSPFWLNVDLAGNVCIFDINGVWKVIQDETIQRVESYLECPDGHDSFGNLYFATSGGVKKLTPDGVVTTIWQTGAQIAVDEAGNVYIADTGAIKIWKVSPDGTVTTAAGNGTVGYSGDGGSAIDASLGGQVGKESFVGPRWPTYGIFQVSVDAIGNLYIADTANHRVRRVTPDGIINTIAGSGQPGFSGDGAVATDASLDFPKQAIADTFGNLYILDIGNDRIRKLTVTLQ